MSSPTTPDGRAPASPNRARCIASRRRWCGARCKRPASSWWARAVSYAIRRTRAIARRRSRRSPRTSSSSSFASPEKQRGRALRPDPAVCCTPPYGLDRLQRAVLRDADLVAALEGERRAALVRQAARRAVVHANGDLVFLVLARLALDLVAGDRTDPRADRRARTVLADLMADHRAADATGDCAE